MLLYKAAILLHRFTMLLYRVTLLLYRVILLLSYEVSMQKIQHFPLRSLTRTYKLSVRELEVLKLMVEGQSNSEIAAQLYLSRNTVKTHVRGIFNKLGVDHRVQAAVVALRQELI
jgi:DNA-binding NarL/FixJ family response regulator